VTRMFLAPVLLSAVACQEYSYSSHRPAKSGPVADAGPDREAQPLDTVQLDGSKSYDGSGREIVAFEWTMVSGPDGSTATLDDPAARRPELFVDLAGQYVFELTVQNDAGSWDKTPDEVVIEAVPLDGFYVEMSWDAPTDLDLHLLRSNAAVFSAGDCSYCNQHPSWGEAGRADDPSLDWDVVEGFGPETITIDDPADDVYLVGVHYFGENGLDRCVGGCAPSEATLNVYVSGALAASLTRTLTDQGDLWEAAEIHWPSGEIVETDDLGHTDKSECD
jgi:PKD domain